LYNNALVRRSEVILDLDVRNVRILVMVRRVNPYAYHDSFIKLLVISFS
jgi:hypothetical protein